MKRIIQFFASLVRSGSQESSKRFLALYSGIILISYLVFTFSSSENVEYILGEIIFFVLVLVGAAVYQATKNRNTNDDERDEYLD